MDRQIRKLEREWAASDDPTILNRLLAALLRTASLEDWEVAAEQHDEYASKYIQLLRNFMRDDLNESSVYVNAYEDFTARTSVECAPSEISSVRRWLRDYYTQNQLFYSGKDVYDVSLQQEVHDPAAQFVVENSVDSCFRMYPGDIARQAEKRGVDLGYYEDDRVSPSLLRNLCPIDRWGKRDHFVSFLMIDSLSGPQEEIAPPEEDESQLIRLPHWINVYGTTRQYGGGEEGGWWFNVDDPITSIYVGLLPGERSGDQEYPLFGIYHGAEGYSMRVSREHQDEIPLSDIPAHLQEVLDFVSQLYEGTTRGDIYSASGGRYLTINLQTHPAVQDPFHRPYYC